MALKMSVGGVTAIEKGVWTGQLSPADIRRFGECRTNVGAISVLGLTRPVFSPDTQTLSIDPDDASVLNIGTSDKALFLDLGRQGEPEVRGAQRVSRSDQFDKADVPAAIGDQAFIVECRRHLNEDLVVMAEELLSAVRQRYPGKLNEGKARKWVNLPDNFFALTIQNRDMSFAVHVKGAPSDFVAPSLDIKKDRGTYSRFKLKNATQLRDTVHVILASAQKK